MDFVETVNNQPYEIRIFKSLEETDTLIIRIITTMTILVILLIVTLLVVNRYSSRLVWGVFYDTIGKINSYDLNTHEDFALQESDVREFADLNRVLKTMTERIKNDYLNLKEYTENASHEIQTPLAIIRSKSELLMQNKNLRKDSIDLIKSINEATNKLFKLNQGLLIISKIENQYYSEIRKISLQEVVSVCLDNYREIMNLRNIRVEFDGSSKALVNMNEVLAEVLVSNLISNAVRYNIDRGFIKVHIDDRQMIISNSGLPLTVDPELLFQRFHKGTDNPQSIGLGLSIVRKITDNYKMIITYTCTGNIHEVRLTYKPEAL
jgi:signal transduction histidine kinase